MKRKARKNERIKRIQAQQKVAHKKNVLYQETLLKQSKQTEIVTLHEQKKPEPLTQPGIINMMSSSGIPSLILLAEELRKAVRTNPTVIGVIEECTRLDILPDNELMKLTLKDLEND